MVIDQWPAAAGEGRNGRSVAPHIPSLFAAGAHFGHRDHSDRFIVISEIGGS